MNLSNFVNYDTKGGYFLYNSVIPNYLDLNKIKDDNTVVFPRNIYVGEPLPEPIFKYDKKDNSTTYEIPIGETMNHPQHLTKFGYDNGCPFGYCYGAHSGRNYNCNYPKQAKVFS